MIINKEKIAKLGEKITSIINSKRIFIILVTVVSTMLIISWLCKDIVMAVICTMIIWIYGIIYSLSNLKTRFLFMVFLGMIFTFILSRPIIAIIRDITWGQFPTNVVWKSIIAIFISIESMLIGYIFCPMKKEKCDKYENVINNKQNKFNMLKIIMIFVLIGSLLYSIGYYFQMRDLNYEAIYISNNLKENEILKVMYNILPYVLCMYLATMPEKKDILITLSIYNMIQIPFLLLGARNGIALSILFSIIYIYLREQINNKKWISKKSIIWCIVMVPIIIAILGGINYIREGEKQQNKKLNIFEDFFYMQGTSFDTVCQGFDNMKELRDSDNVISYTFGGIIDYVIHGKLANEIFGTTYIKSGNSIVAAQESNSMAHHLAYIVLKDNYLAGHGRGSSYIIEVYADFGIIGLIIFSIMLGMFFNKLNGILNRHYILRYIILSILLNVYLMPRGEATGSIIFFVAPYFWITNITVYLIYYLYSLMEDKKNG